MKTKTNPLFLFDEDFKSKSDSRFIIGTDEAGRGPAAGPVCAAAVCFLNLDDVLKEKLLKLNDSKQISEKTREKLYPIILENTVYSIQTVNEKTIDKINILNATFLAMKNAIEDVIRQLTPLADDSSKIFTLVDGNRKIKDFNHPQINIIKGDSKSASIAAASILAKVSRDNFMVELDKKAPEYHWAKNKGYLSKAHIEAIKTLGATEFHRQTFLRNIFAAQKAEQQKLNLK